jgi:hypothetical protein
MSEKESEIEAAQFYDEVHNLVTRWMSEGDKMTCFGMVGALEAVKADLLDNLKKHNAKNRLENEEEA